MKYKKLSGPRYLSLSWCRQLELYHWATNAAIYAKLPVRNIMGWDQVDRKFHVFTHYVPMRHVVPQATTLADYFQRKLVDLHFFFKDATETIRREQSPGGDLNPQDHDYKAQAGPQNYDDLPRQRSRDGYYNKKNIWPFPVDGSRIDWDSQHNKSKHCFSFPR